MITKKINQTVCVAGLAAIVAVSAGCRANKLSLLSDRNIIPPPYKSPQLTQNTPVAGVREMPAIAVTPAVIPSDNAQPVLPGDNATPVFVPAGSQDAAAQPHFDTPEDVSPKTGDAAKAADSQKNTATAPAQPKRTYTVVKGDTLSDIAYMYMVSWRDLAAENNLTEKSVLKVNQKLTLPPNAAKTPRPRQQHKAMPKATPKSSAPAASPRAATPKHPVPADGIYTIVANDNLWDIAKKYGLKSEDIKAVNPNVNWDRLQIGQKINLPNGKVSSAQPKQAAAPAPKPAENKAAVVAPPPLPPKMTEAAPVPPTPPTQPVAPVPPMPAPAIAQPPAVPQQLVPQVHTEQEFPAPPPAPLTPQLNNPPVPAN